MEVIIAPKARSDIASILAWTEETFGPQTLKRYARLIATAIEQIAENPERPAAVRDRKSPSIAEPIISISAASPRAGPGIGFANLGICFSTASLHPTSWRSDASCMIRWIYTQIFRKSIAVGHPDRRSGVRTLYDHARFGSSSQSPSGTYSAAQSRAVSWNPETNLVGARIALGEKFEAHVVLHDGMVRPLSVRT